MTGPVPKRVIVHMILRLHFIQLGQSADIPILDDKDLNKKRTFYLGRSKQFTLFELNVSRFIRRKLVDKDITSSRNSFLLLN